MRRPYTLLPIFNIIFNSIAISSGQQPETRNFLENFGKSNEHENLEELGSEAGCSPSGASIPEIPPTGTSCILDSQHSARSSPPPARARSRSPPPPSRPTLPLRYRALPTRLPSNDKRGYGLEYLGSIRLTPKMNSRRTFKLQRYTFPVSKQLKLKVGPTSFEPVTDQEHIVLSGLDDEVFAILETYNSLTGLYISHNNAMRRTKLNMKNGMATLLTREEMREIPVGSQRIITGNFHVSLVDNSTLHH